MGFKINAGLVSVWFLLKESELPFPFSDGNRKGTRMENFTAKQKFLEK